MSHSKIQGSGTGRAIALLFTGSLGLFHVAVAGFRLAPASIPGRRCDGRRGLTLIELLVATSLLATFAAIAIPNLLEARKGANESSAISTLRTVVASESLFHSSSGGYAGSYGDLISAGWLPADFFPAVPGERDGYLYLLCADPPCSGSGSGPGVAFKALAVPASPGTGNRTFTVDDKGQLLAVVGAVPTIADEVIDPSVGGTSACSLGCVSSNPPPIPTQVDLDAYEAELLAHFDRTMPRLVQVSGDLVIADAIPIIPTPTEWQIALAEIDTGGDGHNEWIEVLSTQGLVAVRNLVPILVGPDPGPPIANDAELQSIFDDYLLDVSTTLALGTASEPATPPVPIATMTGDPVALLQSVMAGVPALGVLGGIIAATALAAFGALRAAGHHRSKTPA